MSFFSSKRRTLVIPYIKFLNKLSDYEFLQYFSSKKRTLVIPNFKLAK